MEHKFIVTFDSEGNIQSTIQTNDPYLKIDEDTSIEIASLEEFKDIRKDDKKYKIEGGKLKKRTKAEYEKKAKETQPVIPQNNLKQKVKELMERIEKLEKR